MKKAVIFLVCLLACIQVETFGRGGGFSGGSRGGGFHSSSRSSSSRSSFGGSRSSSRSFGVRSGSKNSSKIGTGGSKGIRSFSKSSTPRSISRYVGKPFSRPRTIKTSRYARRPVTLVYTRPVVFHNPYLTYYLLSNHSNYSNHRDSIRVDTNAFPGFGKGKSGGGGASAAFADSLKKHCSKSTLEISELLPINFLSDYAGIIPDKDELRINSLIRRYKKLTGVEMAILTVPTLGDEIDLEDYAEVLFDKWGVGDAGVNNGVLIVISSEDEILRVQPGYGLEELLPDIACREIEDNIMIPLCKNKQWDQAAVGAVNDIIKRMGNKPVEDMKKAYAEKKKKEHEEMMNTLYFCLRVILFLAIVIFIYILIIAKRKGK